MISDEYSEEEFFRFGSGFLLKDLIEYVDINNPALNRKIIFVGDDAQLPPVNSNASSALSQKYLMNNYNIHSEVGELTDIVRQLEASGIVKNSLNLRKNINSRLYSHFYINPNYPDIELLKPENVNKFYVEKNKETGFENIIIICRTNRAVKDYNNGVRELIFGNDKAINVGDRILVVANSYNRQIELLNGDFGIITEVSPSTEIIKTLVVKNKERIIVENEFRDVVIRFLDFNNIEVEIPCKIFENLLNSDKPNLSTNETRAIYIDFKIRHPELKPKSQEFKDVLKTDPYFNALRIKYGYAVTCHKAQGGEWKNAIIDFYTQSGILNTEYFRWSYTALTRAKEKAYIVNAIEYKKDIELVESCTENEIINAQEIKSSVEIEKYFRNENKHLQKLYNFIFNLLNKMNLRIFDIIHNNNCERYFLEDEINKYCFDIYYNSKNKISSIHYLNNKSKIKSNDISQKIKTSLESIIGKNFQNMNLIEFRLEKNMFSAENYFIYDSLKNILESFRSRNIFLYSFNVFPWRLRMVFFNSFDLAAFDIVYNSKSQITQIIQKPEHSSSNDLMIEIQNELLEKL